MTQDYTGSKFFEGFSFAAIPDPTNGFVKFVDKATANKTQLAGLLAINGSSATEGPVYLGVSTAKMAANQTGRDSHRVYTNQTWNSGLFIADILHMPVGCGTWPAFWMLGTAGEWPVAGEIDIVEGVNSQNYNAMTLHTNAGMRVKNDSSLFSGNLKTANCDVNDPSQDKNAGCGVIDSQELGSFGEPFNNQDGGVFATQWTGDDIKIWFFNRTHIPADIVKSSPDPSNWPKPNAAFNPTISNNTIPAHFQDLGLIFDTTLCGDWAGKQEVWESDPVCSKKAATCQQYVSENAEAFKDAYWAINSVRVFQNSGAANSSSSNSSAPAYSGALPSNTGGVLAPGASSAASVASPSAPIASTSTLTTMQTVTGSPLPASGAPDSASSAPAVPPTARASGAATSAAASTSAAAGVGAAAPPASSASAPYRRRAVVWAR